MLLSGLAPSDEWRVERLHEGSLVLLLQLAAAFGKKHGPAGLQGRQGVVRVKYVSSKRRPRGWSGLSPYLQAETPKLLIVKP